MLNIETIKAAVVKFNNEYMLEHGIEDRGCCGSATVLLYFGRKRKIKSQLEAAGHVGFSWDLYGKTCYTLSGCDIRVDNDLRVQTYDYWKGRSQAIARAVSEQLAGAGVEVKVHAWID